MKAKKKNYHSEHKSKMEIPKATFYTNSSQRDNTE